MTEIPQFRKYLLNRDWFGSSRLSCQHWLVKQRQGWLIHPTIREFIASKAPNTANNSPLRIVDVAAGNCIWATEVLDEYPDAEVTALDLNTELFPSSIARPKNLHLDTWDMFGPVPEKYQGYFDLVHVRFIIIPLGRGGKDIVARNLASLLRPGGWVQWQDCEPPIMGPIDLKTLDPVPESQWPFPITYIQTLTKNLENIRFMSHLDAVLSEFGGFENTELVRPPVKRGMLKFECDMVEWLYDEILQNMRKRISGSEEKTKAMDVLEKALGEEFDLMRKGEVCWAYSLVVALGRKPGG